MLPITALGPNDPDGGDAGRQQRGMAIAATVPIHKNRLGFKVDSQSGNGSYVVSLDGDPFCSCPDFEKRQEPCKHVYAVEFTVQREVHQPADDDPAVPETVQVAACPQPTSRRRASGRRQLQEIVELLELWNAEQEAVGG